MPRTADLTSPFQHWCRLYGWRMGKARDCDVCKTGQNPKPVKRSSES